MRLATIRRAGTTAAVRVDGDEAVEVGAADVGDLLANPAWRQVAAAATGGARHRVADLDLAPLIPRPEKIICVGLNYSRHIEEMGHPQPDHPTLFAKYPPALVGPYDDIVLPDVSSAMDWEVELAVIVGSRVRYAGEGEAAAAIAGYTVINDITARDWQARTSQFLQGKTFEATTPLGPWLVTADDPAAAPGHFPLRCEVDGEVMQEADTADLVFGPAALVSYCSTVLTLAPGDVIATGTPGGVGAGRRPPRFLKDGEEVVTVVEGIGELRNRCRAEKR
jgi:acylpyruvate hydrolase